MAFEVLITDEAAADLDAHTGFIKRNSRLERAREWFAGIISAIETLREMPERCAEADQAAILGVDVRVLLFGRKKSPIQDLF